MRKWMVAVMALAAFGVVAEAGAIVVRGGRVHRWRLRDPGVNLRQRNQRLRIAQGIRSGSLTLRETQALIEAEKSIAQMERDLKADGALTVSERKSLHEALNAASKEVFGLKHNDADRPTIRKAVLTAVNDPDLTRAEARELLSDCRRIIEIKRLLGGVPLLPARRTALEEELARLLLLGHLQSQLDIHIGALLE